MERTMTWMAVAVAVAVVGGGLALAAPAAHAGGGAGGGGPETQGFLCYTIRGVDQNRRVNLADQFGALENVKIDRSRLLCTPVNVTLPDGEFDEVPIFLADHLTCYDVSVPGRFNLDVVVRLTDPLDVEQLQIRDPKLLCLLSIKEVLQ